MKFYRQQIVEIPVDDPGDLITLSEAAELMGVTVQAIDQRVNRLALAVYIDRSAPQRQGRRLVRRSEVAQAEHA